MLRTLVARLTRDLGGRLLRLAERLATAPQETAQRREEALLRERYPDAPEHWIKLVAARSQGLTAHQVATPPAPRADLGPTPLPQPPSRPVPAQLDLPAPLPAPVTPPDQDGFRAVDAPPRAPAELPAAPLRQRPLIAEVPAPPDRLRPDGAPAWPAVPPRTAPAAAFAGPGRARPLLTLVSSPPQDRPMPAAPRWSDPQGSLATGSVPASFAVAVAQHRHHPTFVETTASDRRPEATAGLTWRQPEHRPAMLPAWPAQEARAPGDLDLPPVAPARHRPPEAAFPEASSDAAGQWPELPRVPERQDLPPADRHAGAYRERLIRLARDQERL